MRKKIFFAITVIALTLVCFWCVGCEKGKFVQSIEFATNQTVNIYEDGFRFSDYTVSVNYTDGTSRDIPLTEDMISPSEQVKLHKCGEWTVEINYLGLTTSFNVKVSKAVIEDFFILKDTVITYNGKPQVFRIDEDDIPAGLTVTYPNGYSFIDVGEYDYKVVVKGDGYEPLTKTCKITIEKADYDLQSCGRVIESGKIFAFDGLEKTVKVENMPNNLTATYTTYKIKEGEVEEKVNAAVDAGEYAVYVNYTCSDKKNYNSIPTERLTFSIEKAKYNLAKINFKPATTTYDGSEKSIKLNDESLLPEGVSVEYLSYKINEQTKQETFVEKVIDAGKYKIIAKFTVSDANYKDIENMEAVLTVNKAEIDMSAVLMSEVRVDYDGEGHITQVSDNLPSYVVVSYYWESFEGLLTKYEEVTEPAVCAGNYTIVAKFSLDTAEHANNYSLSKESLTSYIIINKIKVQLEELGVQDFGNCLTYNEANNSVKIVNLPTGVCADIKLYTDESRNNQVQEKTRAEDYVYVGEFFYEDQIKTKTDLELTEGTYYYTAELYFEDEIRKNSITITPVSGEWIVEESKI